MSPYRGATGLANIDRGTAGLTHVEVNFIHIEVQRTVILHNKAWGEKPNRMRGKMDKVAPPSPKNQPVFFQLQGTTAYDNMIMYSIIFYYTVMQSLVSIFYFHPYLSVPLASLVGTVTPFFSGMYSS